MNADPSSSTPAPVPFRAEIKRKPRTLVLCFDGTGNEYDDTVGLGPSFSLFWYITCAAAMSHRIRIVVKLYSALRKDKVEDQLCYYPVSDPF